MCIMGCSQSSGSDTITLSILPSSFGDKWATKTNGNVQAPPPMKNGNLNALTRTGEIDKANIKNANTSPAKSKTMNVMKPPEFRQELSKQPYQDVLGGRLPKMTKSDHKAKDSSMVDALLQEYRDCEERIRSHEREDPLILYYVKQSRLRNLEETLKRHAVMMEALEKSQREENEKEENKEKDGNSSEKERKISRSLRSAVIKASTSDSGDVTKLPKSEQDVIARKNQLEIAQTELEMLTQEKALLESDIHSLKIICAKLTKDYKRQEEIAGQLSVNSSGRPELELLDELANVETRRIKISEVFERWKEARVQVADSSRQFSSALEKWREMKDDSVENQYSIAEDVRDELITALQFLSNARFYIQSEFPYCTKQEIAILNKALTYIFVDMRSPDRRKHADSCYAAFHNRAVALYAWIDATVKAIIQPVVFQTAEDLKSVMDELQELRFQSIKHQFPNVTWKSAENLPPPLEEAGRLGRSGSVGSTGSEVISDELSLDLLKQLDLSQLAPLPRTVDIFGESSRTEDLVESYKMTLRESIDQQGSNDEDILLSLEELVNDKTDDMSKVNSSKNKNGDDEETSVGLA